MPAQWRNVKKSLIEKHIGKWNGLLNTLLISSRSGSVGLVHDKIATNSKYLTINSQHFLCKAHY